jgi:hypothetical protein
LGETSLSDTQLQGIIDEVSALIEGYCGRSFGSICSVTEVFDIDDVHTTFVRLSYIPVVGVSAVYDEGVLMDPEQYLVYPNIGLIKTADGVEFTQGDQTVEVVYSYGYATPPADVKEVALALCVNKVSRFGCEGIRSERVGNYEVAFIDPLNRRYSTEWNIYKDVLDKYKVDSPL